MAAPTPRPKTGRRLALSLAALVAAGLAVALAIWGWPIVRGYQLFHGHGTLQAKILGGVTLPAAASSCVNCHDGQVSGGPRTIARLDRASLSTPRTPRGGLPVVYDEASFCRLLRDGIDPASVLVSRLMPRFEISDADCAALFAYARMRP